jgi:hypothetical protein
MSSIIPAEQILKGSNAQRILELFGDSLSSSYISSYLEKYISESNKARLSKYNSNSLETDLNDSNLKKEIERLQLTQEKADDLVNLKKEYSKFSKDILLEERFEKINPNKTTPIIGVGVDGSGSYPINFTQETNDIRKIEYEAQTQTKWNPLSDDGEEYLRESVKNVCLWQATNVAQFPIGSPVEVCSAVIQLLSPMKFKELPPTSPVFPNQYTGKQILEKRKEINGLQYLIDGNLLEIDNKNITINGKKDFEKQIFVRFGMNGKNANVQLGVNINLITVANGSTSVPFQCNNSSSATLVSNEVLASLNIIHNSPPNIIIPQQQRVAILFLFTIFFEYGCYIFNMYNEYLIKKIGKSSSVLLEFYKKANLLMFNNYILLINYALIRKFKIKNSNDEYYEPDDFIFVDDGDGTGNLSYDRKMIFKTARRIFPNEIKKGKSTIRIFYKAELYSDPEWNVDIDEFTSDKFPIAFNTDMDLRNPGPIPPIEDVDYDRTIGRLTSFLLQDNGEIPKTGDKVITVGAPFQNEDVFKQTFEALDAYYDFIRNSKRIYKEYIELKLDIFRSSYTAKDINKWYNLFMDRFKITFTSYSNPEQQKNEILRIIDLVIREYKKCRADELKYMDTKVALKKNTFNSSKERYNGIMSMKYGLAAEMIIKIAELTFLIYQGKNPGTPSIFISELNSIKKNVDKENAEKTKKTLEAVKAALYRKLGKNANQSFVLSNRTVTLNNLPPTPPQFTSIFNTALSQLGISIQGISSQTPGVKEAGKIILPSNLRMKVENIKFWQDLRKLFSGRTILIPVAKTRNNKFNDNEFYLVDIFKSVLFNRLKIFKITQNGVINKKLIDSVILNNSYIMMASNEIDLANPVSWRCINYNSIAKLLQGEGTFKNIKTTMGAFFNLIANNSVLLKLMNVVIPPNSNITVGLIKYCNSIMKKELADCTILISRNQFAQTVQSQMGTLTGTSGIDLLSGLSYYQKEGAVTKRSENIVIR